MGCQPDGLDESGDLARSQPRKTGDFRLHAWVPLTCQIRSAHTILVSSTSNVHDERLVLMARMIYGVTTMVTS